MRIAVMTGNRAAAEGAKLSNAQVVAAYPITPQTQIVEYISQFIADGELKAQMVHVESEHSAMSACIGASLVGARAFTASGSQGLALMNECLFAASGLRLPIVMAVANRALSQPPSIYCDHQDSLVVRDSGWTQFYVENCQEALDTIILAYKLAEDERVLLPAMVCLDGFYLSHLSEPVEVPDENMVGDFLPPLKPRYPTLDIEDPKVIGTVPLPHHYSEFKYDMHYSMEKSREVIKNVFNDFANTFGRRYDSVEQYKTEDAEVILLGMGSLIGTAREAIDILRHEGASVGLLKVKVYRPFPYEEVAKTVHKTKVVAVIDRDVSFGSGGILFHDVVRGLYNQADHPTVINFIAGLGGRDITLQTIRKVADEALNVAKERLIKREVSWPDARTDVLKAWGWGE